MDTAEELGVRIVNLSTSEIRDIVSAYYKYKHKEPLPAGWVLSIFKNGKYVIQISETSDK